MPQGPGTSRPASPAQRARPPSPTTEAGAHRPGDARRPQPRAASSPLVLFLRQARNAAWLASAADRRCLDLFPSWIGPAAAGCRRSATDHPPGPRESSLGLSAHPGANSNGLAYESRQPRSAQRSDVMGPIRPREGRPRRGGRSSDSRPPGSSPATSSRSRPSGCGAYTCCSSSSWTPGGSIWPG